MEQVCSQPENRARTLRRYARDLDVLEAIEQISGLLDNPALAPSNASMRIPTALKDAKLPRWRVASWAWSSRLRS